MKEVTCPIALLDHQVGPVAVAIKYKPLSNGTLLWHHPQHGGAVLLVECIACVNEEKPSVLLMGVLLPQEPHHVNTPLDTVFQIPAELLHTEGLLGLYPCFYKI